MLFSLAVLPALSVVGFGPIRPVVGSTAAAWQSSTGLVQAGSFFAWCQGVAMGGAALNGIVASAAVGGRVAAGATLLASLDQAKMMEEVQSRLTLRIAESIFSKMQGASARTRP